MKLTLRFLGILGLLLFGLLFCVTFISPKSVEESAKGFVKQQIEKEVKAKYSAASESKFAEKAMSVAGKLGVEKEQIHKDLEENLPDKIASIIASMCGYDCEKKKRVAASIKSGYLERIKNITIAEKNLADLVKGKYIEIIGNLKLDLRIFLGVNFCMFLMLMTISLLKPQAILQLFLPGIFLFVATIASSGIYIFGQDWFYTILYNDYMGFGYLAYISVIFGFLMDITFNQARVTTQIVEGFLRGIGSALVAGPC